MRIVLGIPLVLLRCSLLVPAWLLGLLRLGLVSSLCASVLILLYEGMLRQNGTYSCFALVAAEFASAAFTNAMRLISRTLKTIRGVRSTLLE